MLLSRVVLEACHLHDTPKHDRRMSTASGTSMPSAVAKARSRPYNFCSDSAVFGRESSLNLGLLVEMLQSKQVAVHARMILRVGVRSSVTCSIIYYPKPKTLKPKL